MKEYVIIGSGIAGCSAAETIRTLEPQSSITLITEEKFLLYSRIAISKYASGQIQKMENLILRTESNFKQKDISFMLNTRVYKIDLNTHTVYAQNFITHTDFEIHYDKLLIATGGKSNKLSCVPKNVKGVFYLYNLLDAKKIKSYIPFCKKAVVSGGSFIGIDFIEIFRSNNIQTVYLIRGPYFLHKTLDIKAGEIIQNILLGNKIEVALNQEIVDVSTKLSEGSVYLNAVNTTSQSIECDIAGIGHGIRRLHQFILESGLKFNCGVITDCYLQTSDPDVFAAGDVAEYKDIYSGLFIASGNWSSARSEGITAGRNMTGSLLEYIDTNSNTTNILGNMLTISGEVEKEELISYCKITSNKYIKLFTSNDGTIKGCVTINDEEYSFKAKLAIKQKRKTNIIDI